MADGHFDVAVVGGGLGGVVAAVRAAELRRRVVLIEARDALGGTALYSGGGVHIWGAQSWPEYRQRCPLANEALARTLFEQFVPLVQWLKATGAPGDYATTAVRGLALGKYQLGWDLFAPSRLAFFGYLARRLRALGGSIVTGARAIELSTRDGRVTGVVVQSRDGRKSFEAAAVVLANGGFQNNHALLTQHVGPAAESFMCRGVAENVGDGLRMALAAGATTSEHMNTVYGHLMPAPPCRVEWSNYNALLLLSCFYVEHGLVVNTAGRRFADEAAGELNGLTINAAATQPPGALWLIIDAAARRRHARYELSRESLRLRNLLYQGPAILRFLRLRRGSAGLALCVDSLSFADNCGATVVHAKTTAQLVQQLAARGVTGNVLAETLNASHLAPGPCHAIEVVPGISMTYGGVRIDVHARALRGDGSAVPGLYAVPGTAGGIHHLHYAGALAACAVYGKIAAETAAGG